MDPGGSPQSARVAAGLKSLPVDKGQEVTISVDLAWQAV
jgi:hypothetical protein